MSYTTNTCRYKEGYKYQLVEDLIIVTELVGLPGTRSTQFLPPSWIAPEPDPYIVLYENGWLWVRAGYAWDGPSGPTIDTANFMRGSLVHDALYQLIRQGKLGAEHRKYADQLLRKMCREDGMSWLRAWWVYRAVRAFGGKAAKVGRKILTAPKKKAWK